MKTRKKRTEKSKSKKKGTRKQEVGKKEKKEKKKQKLAKKRIRKTQKIINKFFKKVKFIPDNNIDFDKQFKKNRHFSSEDTTQIFSDNNSFNENPYLRESHNCYMYFLNKKNNEVIRMCQKDYHKYKLCRRAQPGYVSGHPLLKKQDYKCPNIMSRTLSDNPNIYKIGENDKCIPSHYKGALVVAPNRDYHYYRENDDGQWSHKPGYKPTTTYDSKNNLILNPRRAARDYGGTLNYKDFCGYLCVPRNENKKRMAHWNMSQRGGGGGRSGTRKTKKQKK